jgi:uncharacterized protein Yka (UPF0111/DUF47 family)
MIPSAYFKKVEEEKKVFQSKIDELERRVKELQNKLEIINALTSSFLISLTPLDYKHLAAQLDDNAENKEDPSPLHRNN